MQLERSSARRTKPFAWTRRDVRGRKTNRYLCRAGKKGSKKEQEYVVGGGGFDGACEIDDIKAALENCKGLEGPALEACWAEYGCSVDKVTRHYAKVAGLDVDTLGSNQKKVDRETE